jgi:hypothetical protein
MLCCALRQLQDALQQQAARLNAAAAERLDVLATAHAAELQQLQQSADAQLQQLKRQHAASQDAWHSSHQQAMQQQHEAHAADLQAAAAKARKDAEALQLAAAGSQSELEKHLRLVAHCHPDAICPRLHIFCRQSCQVVVDDDFMLDCLAKAMGRPISLKLKPALPAVRARTLQRHVSD